MLKLGNAPSHAGYAPVPLFEPAEKTPNPAVKQSANGGTAGGSFLL
jgi:hypothetical protein